MYTPPVGYGPPYMRKGPSGGWGEKAAIVTHCTGAGSSRAGAEQRVGTQCAVGDPRNSDPMIEAGEPSTKELEGVLCNVPATPGIVMVAPPSLARFGGRLESY
jgi:hypothetical protein